MVRGKRKLYPIQSTGIGVKAHRQLQRDKLWAARYYYYAYLVSPRMNYEDILSTLAIEMGYLSPRTISDCLLRCAKDIKALEAANTDIIELRRQYAWLVWDKQQKTA